MTASGLIARLKRKFPSIAKPAPSADLKPQPLCTHGPSLLRIVYFPDYRPTNQYQTILYSGLNAPASARAGTIADAIGLCGNDPAEKTIFHLHWPEVVFAGAAGIDQMHLRAETFLEQLQQFRVLGGYFVWTIHNAVPHDRPDADFFREFQAELMSRADLIHVHSQAAIDVLAATTPLPRSRCVVVPHPSYLGFVPEGATREASRAALGLPADAFVAAMVGQLRPYKGLEGLLAAFRRLRIKHDEAHLLIAGKPVLPTKPGFWKGLGHVVAGLHVAEGFIPEEQLQTYFAAADIVVLPYTDVLTSGSALLAATFGKPMIMPLLPSLREIAAHESVITYDPSDRNGLYSALLKAYSLSTQERSAMSAASLRLAHGHSPARTSAALLDHLRGLTRTTTGARQVDGKEIVLLSRDNHVEAGSIGIAIVSYRSADEVIALLETIPARAAGRAVNVYILDNSEDDWHAGSLKDRAVRAVVVQAGSNFGYAGGNNVLLSLMRERGCEYAMILNPDTRLKEGALEALLAYAEAHPDDIISPLVLRQDGRVSFGGSYVSASDDLCIVNRYDGEPLQSVPAQPYVADLLNGCAIFLRLGLLSRIGPIPEDYFLYYEETDWLLRAADMKVDRVVVPQAHVVHTKRSHGTDVPTLYYVYYLLRNALIFQKRRGKTIARAEKRLRSEFVEGWESKLRVRQPSFVPIFLRTVEAAFADGRAGVCGRAELGERLDLAKVGIKGRSAGFVESVEKGFVTGWAVDQLRTGGRHWQPATVWLIVDGIAVSQVEATRRRPDVVRAGYTELAGFQIPVPLHLRDGGKRHIEVRSAATGLRIPFLAKAQERSRSARFFNKWREDAAPKYRGYVDGFANGRLRGWVMDESAADRIVWIDLKVNGTRLPTIAADQYRDDLAAAKLGDGRHAFELAIPKRVLLTPSASSAQVNGGAPAVGPVAALASNRLRLDVVMLAGGTDQVVASKSIVTDDDDFSVEFSADQFFSWAFINERMPIGAYDRATGLREFFAENRRRLADEARGHEPGALVSIVMPAYNRASVVSNAIQSVLDQQYGHWELLIVDDGSQDHTVEIVEQLIARLGDRRIRLLKHAANRGVSAARNTALEAATGSYVAYLDSDNTWYPDYLAIMVAWMEASPQSIAAYAGQEIWEHLPAFGETELRWIRCCPFNRSRLEQANYIDLNVFFHRRDAVAELGTFREDMKRLVDWELILRYTEHRPPIFVPALLCRYFVNIVPNQITLTVEHDRNRSKVDQDLTVRQSWRARV